MTTRSLGIGRGGPRPGSGRKPGSRNKKTALAELLPKLAEPDRQLPLYRLLDRVADESLDPKYRDVLSIACLPYLHAKMPTILTAKPEFLMTDEELIEVRHAQEEHEKQAVLGRSHLRMTKGG